MTVFFSEEEHNILTRLRGGPGQGNPRAIFAPLGRGSAFAFDYSNMDPGMKRVAEEMAHAEAIKKAKIEGMPGPPFHTLVMRGAPMQMPPQQMQGVPVDAPPPPPPPLVVSNAQPMGFSPSHLFPTLSLPSRSWTQSTTTAAPLGSDATRVLSRVLTLAVPFSSFFFFLNLPFIFSFGFPLKAAVHAQQQLHHHHHQQMVHAVQVQQAAQQAAQLAAQQHMQQHAAQQAQQVLHQHHQQRVIQGDLDAFWSRNLTALAQYKAEHHGREPPASYVLHAGDGNDDLRLGRWCDRQRTAHKNSKLSPAQIQELSDIGFEWDPLDASWTRHIEALKRYKADNNGRDPPQTCQVPGAGKGQVLQLGFWCFNRKQAKKQNKLKPEKIAELDDLGFDWEPHESFWHRNIEALKKYKADNKGRCEIRKTFATKNLLEDTDGLLHLP